jgi:hypothetical protein
MDIDNGQDQTSARVGRMAAMLTALGRSHNEYSSRELTLMLDAWDAAHDEYAPPPGLKFADFTWPSRWNKGDVVAALSQTGAEVTATSFFGVLRFRLDQPEDGAAIVNAARRFADMVEETYVHYLGG